VFLVVWAGFGDEAKTSGFRGFLGFYLQVDRGLRDDIVCMVLYVAFWRSKSRYWLRKVEDYVY